MKPLVSVVTLLHEKRDYQPLFRRLLSQRTRFPYEVIAVDDNKVSNGFDGVRVIQVPRCSPAEARNIGWRNARGSLVAFIDSDCLPPEDWLENLVSSVNPNSKVAGVGGGYFTVNKNSLIAWLVGEEIRYRHVKMPRYVDFVGSFSCLFKREVLEEVGGFNPDFREADSEDNDLSYRIREAGYLLRFNPEVKVGHIHPDTLWKYLRQQFKRAYWRVLLYKKHRDRVAGDQYSSVYDFIQALLALNPLGFIAIPFFHLRKAVVTYRRTGEIRSFSMIPVFTLRAFSWMLGLLKGLIAFRGL